MTNQTPVRGMIWTIGHSTRSLSEFVGLLDDYRVEAVADVRRFPGSRRYPQFAREAMIVSLPKRGIEYQWLPKLGGRRRARPDSPNTAWRNASFRGYADYLMTADFSEGLSELLAIVDWQRTAIMCSELLWWRCHRALIADVLLLRGWSVVHILDATHATSHSYTSPAKIVDNRLSYTAGESPA